MRRSSALTLALVLAAACATPRPRETTAVPGVLDASGFLDDYSILRLGGPDEVALVYRDPDAVWTSYDKVLFEPVTLWRSGRKSLDSVPEKDLLRLIADFEGAVRRRLGKDFELVEQPGPGVMLIRLAITDARASDPILDVLRAHGTRDATRGDGPVDPETRRFIEHAQIEGDIRDANTDRLLAAGVDRRRREGALPVDTWANVDRALDFWADRVCARLEARTGADGSRRPRKSGGPPAGR